MQDKEHIREIAGGYIADSDLFIVDVKVSSTSRITVIIDKSSGSVTVSECALLSRHIEEHLDRDKEDFELQVSSPGLEMPFLVHEQYIKNEGRDVEVIGKDGIKRKGVLKNVTPGGFEIEYTATKKVKGKGKERVTEDISYNFDEVKGVRAVVKFK